MELILRDSGNSLIISKNIFDYSFNKGLIHQVVTAYMAKTRQGTSAQKSRSEVSGSGKKPWRQKGTGRARSGSIRSPIWRSGGVTFAGKTKNYNQKINKKMYRGAIKSILSELLRQKRLIILESFSITSPKTKLLVEKLKEMSLNDVLIIVDKISRNLLLASRNLYKVTVCNIRYMNPINLITFNYVVLTKQVIKQIEEQYSKYD